MTLPVTTHSVPDWIRRAAKAINNLTEAQNVAFNPLDHALEVIKSTYGVTATYKPKMLTKFGRFASLGASYETVQEQGGNETYLTSNLIDTVVSDNAGDTGLVRIEGHTIDGGGNLTFTVQEATLNGTTNVALATPLARATRLVNKGTADFAGTITVIDASAPSVIYVQADGVHNTSEKASTSISQYDYYVITQVFGAVLKKNGAAVDFSLQVRESGGVFMERYAWDGNSTAPNVSHSLNVPIIVPANSDVRIVGAASATNVEVIARMAGYLALDSNAP